jgi:2-(1,2-epoxy-1,2-dihydrophenyl)acetyl-CoA isomerase
MSDYELVHAYETVELHRAGAAARLRLNRPQKMNAWNEQLGHDLNAAIERVADLSAGFPAAPDGRPDIRRVLRERYHPIILRIREMPKPVVASVHGPAVGIGCSLALACDLVLAAESAYFLLAFVNIGLVPDGGSSALVPARVGLARAAELALLGERLPARQALDWGLINAVHADGELEAAADALLARLAAGPTLAYAGAKRQLNAWAYRGLAQQLELEAEIQGEQAGTEDFVEGVTAFMSKRTPNFRGA